MKFGDLRSALVTWAAIYAVATAAPAMAQDKTFDVGAQSASTGIPELARQADIQILVSEDAVKGKRTNSVKGRMSVSDCLREPRNKSRPRCQALGSDEVSGYSQVPSARSSGLLCRLAIGR